MASSKYDVIIVGAGIAGLTNGYQLLKAGYDVTILERDDAVGGLSRTYKFCMSKCLN